MKEIFVEEFHKDIFFVLVCGPFLLIENFFSLQRNCPAVRSLLRWKMSAFLLQSFDFWLLNVM
jgi:hypothetical protein